MFRLASATLVALVVVGFVQAEPLKIGASSPKFSGLEDATMPGKSVSLADLKDKDVVVFCVTCNHCPVAIAYEDRLIDFAKKHAGPDSKVKLIAFSVNTGEDDSLPKMK